MNINSIFSISNLFKILVQKKKKLFKILKYIILFTKISFVLTAYEVPKNQIRNIQIWKKGIYLGIYAKQTLTNPSVVVSL